jgi:hypothetical protein
MGYRVFAQSDDARIDPARLVQNARSYFEPELDVLGQSEAGAEESLVRLELASAAHGWRARFVVTSRAAQQGDLEAARAAEVRGQATGMAALAERCRFVWEVEPEADAPEVATLSLCGLLASVALGPVLPPCGSTLFGVRGSMERAEQLLRTSSRARS